MQKKRYIQLLLAILLCSTVTYGYSNIHGFGEIGPDNPMILNTTETPIYRMEIEVDKYMADIRVQVYMSSEAEYSVEDHNLYKYLKITSKDLKNENIERINLTFKIHRNRIDKIEDVALLRYVEEEGWKEVRTNYQFYLSGYYYYTVLLDKISPFAIVTKIRDVIEIRSNNLAQNVAYGQRFVVPIIIKNPGKVARKYTVAVIGEDRWATAYGDEITIQPGETDMAYAHLTVRKNAPLGNHTYYIKVNDQKIKVYARVSSFLEQEVTEEIQQLENKITITNTGNINKAYTLKVEGIEEWGQYEIRPSNFLLLEKGKSQVFEIIVAPYEKKDVGKEYTVKIMSGDKIVKELTSTKTTTDPVSEPRSYAWANWILYPLVIVLLFYFLRKKKD